MIQEINSIMKILFKHTRLFTLLLTLLLLGSVANHAWAYKVTYHILTLPIDNDIYHMEEVFGGKRLEAVRVVVDKVTTLPELPDAYKSPLVTENSFKYYASSNVTKSANAENMYDYAGTKNKSYYYTITDENNTVSVGTALTEDNTDIYVTYEYNTANTIADLSGNTEYNLTMSGGFWGFNRGRNNRIAVFKEDLNLVNNDALVNEDFTQFAYTIDNKIPNTNISTYWKDNKTSKDVAAGKFHFIFKFEGSDPYNILIGTTYNGNETYLEKHGSEQKFYYKWYKGSHLFRPSSDGTGYFMSSDEHKKYTTSGDKYNPDITPTTEPSSGYYKSKGKDDLTYSTFALLNNSHSPSDGYVFMLSRFINSSGDIDNPSNNKYNFLIRDGNYNNLTYASKTLADATKDFSTDQKIYRVVNYVYKVTKKISGIELAEKMRVSEYFLGENPTDFIPESLRRKYVTYKAYSDAGMTNEVTTFTEAATNCADDPNDGIEGKVIYLDYEVNMPFETWKASESDADSDGEADYDEMKWYNFYVNKSSRNSAYWDDSKIKTSRDLSKYSRKSHYAFIGDPYDLQIVCRMATDNASGTFQYMKLASPTITNPAGFDGSGTTWGIVYDDDTDDFKDCFRLKDNSSNTYLHQDTSTDNPLNGTATLGDAVRITVDNLPTKNYIYYIMRNDNDKTIAVMSQGRHEPSAKLSFSHIPAPISSPFIKDVPLQFYGGYTASEKGKYTSGEERAIAEARAGTPYITYAPENENGDTQYIVVRYTFNGTTSPTNYSKINGSTETATFNVRLNGQYIYYDQDEAEEANKIKSSATIESNVSRVYNWTLGGGDPYAMNIKPYSVNKYVAIPEKSDQPGVIDWPHGDEKGVGRAITWTSTAPSSKYIIKSSSIEGTYEVMGATGDDYDAMEETFNFGRPEDNTVRIYSDWSYQSGWEQLRFELVPPTANDVTYHLIDIKNNEELLSVVTRQASTDAPSFPPDYRSPLVAQYHYWELDNFNVNNDKYTLKSNQTELSTVVTDIYVTYTANDLVDMSGRTLYLLKYALGDQFLQEDGSDGLLAPIPAITGTDEEKKQIADANKYRYQAVYPYCNGDCNFFVYGQEQYDIQQQSAASTRTRWAWYVESGSRDPYHVMIRSRQQETYPAGSGNDYNAYFRTYAETYGGSQHVVTTLAWPGISGVQGTEYMVLGSKGQFRLVTSDEIYDGSTTARRPVNSFEQYWKTWDTVRKKVLGDKNAVAKQSDPNTVPETPAAPTASAASVGNRTYLTGTMSWHSYEQWAYAKRWNGYNISGKTSKGWENIEHWYQTVQMGEGYFDFVPTTIDPVLILLDQHGWEVMRKPLPNGPDDPDKYAKYDAIRPYDSPMVKEYAFWSTAKKRTGFHQYYLLSDRIGGEDFTSTSLTNLPPYDSENVKDSKGNLLDQYVTYIVKDEYAQTYNPSSKTGQPFLIEQGSHFVKNDNNAIATENVPTPGGMSQYIISNISELTTTGDKKDKLWYVKPNTDIDIEMGYQDATKFPEGYTHNWDSKTPNAYEDSKYSALKAAVYVKETEEYKGETADNKKKLTDKYGEFSFSNGFDPYNIQISSVSNGEKFFVTNATKAEIDEGVWEGNGSTVSLDAVSTRFTATGHDSRSMPVTNATFMAVQDADGNMQLMPRFDQEKRLKDFKWLVHTDDPEVENTYTKLYRPLVYNYHIIDNSGQEALRYQGGGDLVPQTPEWFQSQLAKDYKYYAGISGSTGQNEITESLEGASLTDKNVYVRYSYDETADYNKILQGKWLTMTVNSKDAVYSEGVKQASITKPDPVDASYKEWQWKFIADSQTDPDPYAVSLYNRNTDAGTATVVNSKTKFALLNWYANNGVDPTAYVLAVHGLGTVDNYDYTYQFVNGASMSTSVAATTATEENVKSTSCSYTAGAKIDLTDDVSHTYTYKVYTNDNLATPAHDGKYGVFAVSAEQDYFTVSENDYVPILPEEIRSPLLNIDQFKYYGAEADMGDATKELKNIFGLYDDVIYVRYTDYDLNKTEYKVPNVKTVVDSKVARGETSNDAALDINNELLYNIIWYEDNMMQSTNNSAITSHAGQDLHSEDAYVWKFEGNDPYAIKIKHNNSNKYAVGTDALADGATSTFMLLPSTDSEWQYGVLQVTGTTGNSAQRLTGFGNALTPDASTSPTKFIIFGLSTHTVIYHLLIAKTCTDVDHPQAGEYIDIPYRATKGGEETTKRIYGSSQRDLTSKKDDVDTNPVGSKYQLGTTINGLTYCVNEGHITLGDPLKVPEALERPNCKYFYYVEGIYTDEACTEPYTDLHNKYRGLQITQMGTEPALLGKTVLINVEYQFDDGLPTNNGTRFVTNTSGTQWYTFETNDEKPYLAHYTYKDAMLTGIEGRIGHYTNDFLWSPVGDPYGFKMYNRYVSKNGGNTTYVMTTSATPAPDADLIITADASLNKPVYELLAGETDGCFKVQTLTIPESGTPFYIDNSSGVITLQTSTDTEWTFGLSDALLEPYYLGAGNVGGLTTEPKSGTGKSGVKLYKEAANLIAKQEVVFNPDNIVDFTPGYYRIFSEPNSSGIKIPRYLSGYTHKTELTPGTGTVGNPVAIPMHFYEKKGVTTTFEALGSGFTTTAATQGQIPIVAPEYDPASIFYISSAGGTAPYTMQTQGLYVDGAVMATSAGTNFYVDDIGGAVVVLHDGNADVAKRYYLNYDQTDPDHIYDVKYTKNIGIADQTKWCMEPANKLGLYIETHSGGEEEVLTTTWYYSTYCVPFDLLIADKNGEDKDHSSNAYTCVSNESPWPGSAEEARKGLHPKPIGKYNTGDYHDNDYFVPAGTPVIFSTKRATEYIKATIPTNSPSTSIPTIFSAKYLEQTLPGWDNNNRVYVFGPKMEGTMNINTSNGDVTATLPSLGNTNVGFHLNANPNKEAGLMPASWTRNNYYVLHNRIYYIATPSAGAKAAEFVPLIFDFDEDIEEEEEMKAKPQTVEVSADKVYDVQGRCIAIGEDVLDGSWKNNVAPGLYIIGGKKVYVGK